MLLKLLGFCFKNQKFSKEFALAKPKDTTIFQNLGKLTWSGKIGLEAISAK